MYIGLLIKHQHILSYFPLFLRQSKKLKQSRSKEPAVTPPRSINPNQQQGMGEKMLEDKLALMSVKLTSVEQNDN